MGQNYGVGVEWYWQGKTIWSRGGMILAGENYGVGVEWY